MSRSTALDLGQVTEDCGSGAYQKCEARFQRLDRLNAGWHRLLPPFILHTPSPTGPCLTRSPLPLSAKAIVHFVASLRDCSTTRLHVILRGSALLLCVGGCVGSREGVCVICVPGRHHFLGMHARDIMMHVALFDTRKNNHAHAQPLKLFRTHRGQNPTARICSFTD